MNPEIFTVQNHQDLERCYPIMKELRPHLNFEDYILIYENAHRMDQYQIAGFQQEGKILALMGYRTMYDYVRGKYIYVDDLVTTESARSQGLGAKLLKYAQDIAEQQGCRTLRLCTGISNERGIKFYEKNGWLLRSYAYVKKWD